MNRFETSIEINLEPSACFVAGTDFSSFPEMMKNIRDVRHLGDNQWRWTLDTVTGQEIDLDTEVHYHRRDNSLSWVSANGLVKGEMRFEASGSPSMTRMVVTADYNCPTERLMDSLAHTTQAIRVMVDEDLENFKEWMEDNPMVKSNSQQISQETIDEQEKDVVNIHYGIEENLPEVGTSTEIEGSPDDVTELMVLEEEEVPYAGLNNGAIYTEDNIDQRDDGLLNGEQEATDLFANSMDIEEEDLDNFTEDMDEEYDAVSDTQIRSGSEEGFSASAERNDDRGFAANEQPSSAESGQSVR